MDAWDQWKQKQKLTQSQKARVQSSDFSLGHLSLVIKINVIFPQLLLNRGKLCLHVTVCFGSDREEEACDVLKANILVFHCPFFEQIPTKCWKYYNLI